MALRGAKPAAFLAGRLRSAATFFRRLAGVMALAERLKIRIRMIVPGHDMVNFDPVARASPTIRQKGPAAETVTLENVGTLLAPILGKSFTPGRPRPTLSQLTHSLIEGRFAKSGVEGRPDLNELIHELVPLSLDLVVLALPVLDRAGCTVQVPVDVAKFVFEDFNSYHSHSKPNGDNSPSNTNTDSGFRR